MSRTIINVGAVIDANSQINSAKSSVGSAKSSFTRTKNSVDGKIQNRSNIRNRLSTVHTQLNSIDSQLGKIRSMVESGANQYRSTDDMISSWRDDIRNAVGASSAGRISGAWASWFRNPDDIGDIKGRIITAGTNTLHKVKDQLEEMVSTVGVVGTVGDPIPSSTSAQSSGHKESADVLETKEDSLFEQILKDDWKLEGAVLAGSVTGSSEFLGVNTSGTASGELVGGSIKTKSEVKWDFEDKEASIEKSISAEGHLAKGSLEGNYGILGGKIEGTVGSVGASGSIGASLYKDGKLSPALQAELKAKAAVAEGEAEVKIGNDEFNGHVKGEGTLLGAEASASGGAGMITYKDETTGQTKTELGLEGKLEAEAYLAEGTISGGFTIFGIDIDVGLSGKAGGAGVEAGGRVTTGGVSGKIGAGLGLGLGLELSIDWSDFSLW